MMSFGSSALLHAGVFLGLAAGGLFLSSAWGAETTAPLPDTASTEDLRQSSPYSAGLALERSGDLRGAAAEFASVNGPLRPHAVLRASRCLDRSGDTTGALRLLDSLPQTPGASPVVPAAALLRAALVPVGQAIPTLRSGLEQSRERRTSTQLRTAMIQHARASGESRTAIEAAYGILRTPAAGGPASILARQVLEEAQRDGVLLPMLDAATRVDWGRRLRLWKRLGEAREALEGARPTDPGTQRSRAMELGHLYLDLKDADRAVTAFTRARSLSRSAYETAEARYHLARARVHAKDVEGALAEFLDLAAAGHPTGLAGSSLYQASILQGQRGERLAAAASRARLLAEFPSSYVAGQQLWSEGWTAYQAKKWGRAARHFSSFARHQSKSRRAPAARYWSAVANFRDQKRREALAAVHRAGHAAPDLYSALAGLRLRGGPIRFARSDLRQPKRTDLEAQAPRQPRWSGPDGPPLHVARQLFDHGDYRGAAREIIHHIDRIEPAGDRAAARLTLSRCYRAAGMPCAAVYQAELLQATGAPVSKEELLPELYPLARLDALTEACTREEVDPLLVLAVAREESRFRADDRSHSDARGVMQVLPSTGRWIARKLNLSGFTADRLYDPALSYRLGAWYLRYLLDKFRDYRNPELLAMAAYNGGPGNVERWLDRWGRRPIDEFIEAIPLPETRFYVDKVSRSLLHYEKLYGVR